MLRQAGRALAEGAGRRDTVLPMPALAPFGEARVEVAGCTLCVACTSVCPTGRAQREPGEAAARFLEDACVQCGLCAATCPEKVITSCRASTSRPRAADPRGEGGGALPLRALRQALRREEPDRPRGGEAHRLGHWMFRDPKGLAVLRMCEECRSSPPPMVASTPMPARPAR
jgi:ferredoxin